MRIFPALSLAAGAMGVIASSVVLAADTPVGNDPSRDQWRETMLHMQTPHAGCFHAKFPSMQWEAMTCLTAIPGGPHPVPRISPAGESQTTGNGADYALVATGLISETVGSFPSVAYVVSESGVGGSNGIDGPNEYSLQINTNDNSRTSACSGGGSGCLVWQQFVYSPDAVTKGTAGVYMQYWLLDYGAACPSGYMTYGPDCYKNSSVASAPDVAITGLASLKMTGAVVSGGNDTVTFTDGTQAYSVSASDSVLDVATVWTQSEFNVFGNGGASEAEFNEGASVTVHVAVEDGSTSAPTCQANDGTTGETNNLNLGGSCSASGGATPSIQFAESVGIVDKPTVTYGQNSQDTIEGFDGPDGIGSISPTKTSNGYTYVTIQDHYAPPQGGGSWANSRFAVSGFSSDPGSTWLGSVQACSTAHSGASATYAYSSGSATWIWTTSPLGVCGGVVTIAHE